MSKDYPGFFLTLEGPEGCGKTSLMPNLVSELRDKGFTVYPTREPGGTSIGEQIRDVIHSLKNVEIHPKTETLLYQAARAQIVAQEIIPRLKKGEFVVSDRFFDSTLAYQGFGHRQDLSVVKTLIEYATGGLTPDLTALLDLPVEIGLERKKGEEWNRMDALDVEFHRRVRDGYHTLLSQNPERFVVVDAAKSRSEVLFDLINVVQGSLPFANFIEGRRLGNERQV